MIKIGITGGICSGKSTVCSYIEKLGYDVFYSDQSAINLAETNLFLKNSIIEKFGPESYLPNGSYNRKYIAGIVFSDKPQLDLINSLFSPYLFQEFEDYCVGKEVIFYESALIFEHNLAEKFDYVVCVYANKQTVVKRLKERNNFTDEEIENRINSQLDPLIKLKLSNYWLTTSNGQYKKQVKILINKILS